MRTKKHTIRIAVMTVNQVEDMELFIPVDIWKRAGILVDIIVCELRNGFTLAYSGVKVSANSHLNNTNFNQYDAIYLPGGPGYERFLIPPATQKNIGESKLHEAIKRFASEKNKWLIGMCASPVVYFSLIEDPKFRATKFTSFNDKNLLRNFEESWVNEPVWVENNLITAQAAGNAFDLAFTVVEKLLDPAIAHEIATRINYPWDKIKRRMKVFAQQ
ncbi:4-methyl-5(b-hydroxyethyl)-thiazole monophosphate biosynthesis [Mycoplasmoides fastidiosum]|uniref:4-methyl-5(B-hydroxyethyl)-thiazole monophosphate biosynthesis n=1 Tax=Mycoplasmoides fastidiosum TaxID=92758 RepID=A0ABU0LZ82_9BACT|nr:DJ-1/PfpI family protein [Mycoplasmoides fastidiosum]MDQ0514017.1 4-methyl-5(b-hydroxyethyl)-thiazole monophosphate biosynthesis [Mycoplasmoides fastidiosum]UUD37573.1 DJ-1/PfpI family protein [Mycoplasmoides fastidiosum]